MIILHGKNIIQSRQKLKNLIDDFKVKGEVLRFEGNEIDLVSLNQSLESSSLMGENRLIIIENIFSGRKTNEKGKILNYLKKVSPKNLIIWEGEKIDGRTLSSFKARILRFDLSPLIFRFLDSFVPNNSEASLILLHQCLEQDSPEMVFYMLSRQIRLLILAADLGKKGLGKMEEWQKEKLIRQAQKFGLIRLLKIYRKLLKIDWEQKTGQTPLDLTSQLDLLITSL